MKKLFVILLILTAFSVNAQWVVQTSGITANLYDVEFINRYTGWACGRGGKILKTTNGGINWMNIPNPSYIGGGNLISIFPVDSLYCYVSGGYNIILKTTNGGVNWIEISNGPLLTGSYNGVHFLNRDTGWFCRGGHLVLRTTNGCLSFDTVITPSSTIDIYFRNFNEGLYCTEGLVYKTTNSGMNWFNTNVPTNGGYQFEKLSVVNNQYVSIVGGSSPFYRSTDFCSTWQCLDSIHSFPPAVLNCCAFSSVNIGYAGGTRGYLYKTTNGGINWYRQWVDTGTNLMEWLSIYCLNDSIVWGVGGAGFITHTTNGGEWLVGIQNTNTETPEKYSLSQNYPNPFNNQTKIRFEIPRFSEVRIVLYDILGKLKDIILDGIYQPGKYEVNYSPNDLSSGIYFYKMEINGEITKTKKLMLKK